MNRFESLPGNDACPPGGRSKSLQRGFATDRPWWHAQIFFLAPQILGIQTKSKKSKALSLQPRCTGRHAERGISFQEGRGSQKFSTSSRGPARNARFSQHLRNLFLRAACLQNFRREIRGGGVAVAHD